MSAQKAAQVVSRLDIPSDEGDLSQQHHEEWIFLNRNTIDMKLLREIADALHRMDIGQYGVCPECEEPISSKRLDAVPWARYCVTCQEKIAARIADGEVIDEFQEAEPMTLVGPAQTGDPQAVQNPLSPCATAWSA